MLKLPDASDLCVRRVFRRLARLPPVKVLCVLAPPSPSGEPLELGALRQGAEQAGGATLRPNVGAWQEVLSRGALVRQRPPRRPDGGVIWSALEYGCHVRDVFVLFDERLRLMLTQQDPTFLNWDQDATAIAKRYWEDDPMTVREALREAGDHLADAFDQVRDHQWARTGTRSDGARFTVESFGRYFLHDPIHHLWDVTRGFAALA